MTLLRAAIACNFWKQWIHTHHKWISIETMVDINFDLNEGVGCYWRKGASINPVLTSNKFSIFPHFSHNTKVTLSSYHPFPFEEDAIYGWSLKMSVEDNLSGQSLSNPSIRSTVNWTKRILIRKPKLYLPLVLLLACCICKFENKFVHRIIYIWGRTKNSSRSYRINATPRGFPVILSRKIFFCTIKPYLPNISSSCSSFIVRGRFVTYKLVSFNSSPAGRANETYGIKWENWLLRCK